MSQSGVSQAASPEPSQKNSGHFLCGTNREKPIVMKSPITSSTGGYLNQLVCRVLFREWIVQIISPTLRINRFHKMTGEILNPIHYLLFYTELNHYTTNNCCVSFYNRLSPIRTSLRTDLEPEAFELQDEWQK